MTPRVDIFAWQDSLRLGDIADQLHRVPHSRIPVYGESLDNMTGALYLRDAYEALSAGQADVELGALAREALFIPGSVSLIELLRIFQAQRVHLCLVVDEHGGIDGLVTLEDVLEELVGEIEDETDLPDDTILPIARDAVLVRGGADLRDINRMFATRFPVTEHRSLNGYLLQEFGRVPEPSDSIEREGVRIEVLRATETRVKRARLTRLPKETPDPGTSR